MRTLTHPPSFPVSRDFTSYLGTPLESWLRYEAAEEPLKLQIGSRQATLKMKRGRMHLEAGEATFIFNLHNKTVCFK